MARAVGSLIGASVLAAWMSEILVGAAEGTGKSLGMSQTFIGIVFLAIVGGAAESGSAIAMARKNKMDLSVGIALGSSIQIALFVAPVLVLLSYFIAPQPLELSFNRAETGSLFMGVLIGALVCGDGQSNWYKGVQLVTVYTIIALMFYFIPELARKATRTHRSRHRGCMQTPTKPARLERNLGWIALLLLLVGCLLVLRPVRVRAALGGGVVRFELAVVSTAAQVAPGPAHLGRVAHGARDDSGHAVALSCRGFDARGQRQGTHLRRANMAWRRSAWAAGLAGEGASRGSASYRTLANSRDGQRQTSGGDETLHRASRHLAVDRRHGHWQWIAPTGLEHLHCVFSFPGRSRAGRTPDE